jgi:uncharacterized coiled-coil protein SlyX
MVCAWYAVNITLNNNAMFRITKNARKQTIQSNINILENAIVYQERNIKGMEKDVAKHKRWVNKDRDKLAQLKMLIKTK